MPLVKLGYIGKEAIWGVWEITETISELLSYVYTADELLSINKRFINKQKEKIAARAVAQSIAQHIGLPKSTIQKDSYGCPYWAACEAKLSLSHTRGFAAALIHCSAACGIDIELPQERIRKIAPRVFSPSELQQAGNDLYKLTTLWCAKEALYKWHRVGSLDFRTQLQIEWHDNRLRGFLQTSNYTASPFFYQETFGELVVVCCWM
ncbi:MAG: 4'-phosphopantetheinyl transferase superfamily protein [Cytophagales bacterium]|nr:4'-phosphopantetheinyl transferase superfamily protein [Bernardetiaceae bacterium]MDW8205733.1 4'-phosphopantetheinyl transferase superfamily protein [Cytophagales bacterium]